jgi:hypothetical protein
MKSLLVASLALFGCSNSSNGGPPDMDLASPPDLSPPDLMAPAKQPFPQVSPNSGTIFANPQLVTLTWADDPLATHLEAFGDFVVGSNWLKAWGPEYGVKGATHVQKYRFAAVANKTIDEATVLTDIKNLAMAQTLAMPSSTNNQLLYLIYVPKSYTFTSMGMTGVCGNSGALGYHAYDKLGGTNFAYAVNGNCGGSLGEVTSTAAHEIAEAATDPITDNTAPGWSLAVDNTSHWIGQNGDEIGDLCQYDANITEGAYQLQRIFSNTAATQGASPCIPIPPGEVFFDVSAAPAPLTVPVGTTASYTLGGWTDASSMSDWQLSAFACDSADFDPMASFSKSTIGNQKTVTVTLTVPLTAKSGQIGCSMVFSGPSQKAQNYWPVSVIVQ